MHCITQREVPFSHLFANQLYVCTCPLPLSFPPTPLVHHTKLSSLCCPAGAHWLPGVQWWRTQKCYPLSSAHPLLPPCVSESALYVFISLPDLTLAHTHTCGRPCVQVCVCAKLLQSRPMLCGPLGPSMSLQVTQFCPSVAEQYSIVYVDHILFIHSSADGRLGCFHVLAIINSAAVNAGVEVSF